MLVAQAATGGGLDALALAVVVAMVYLFVIRALDLNEKEPLWAVALVLGLGAVAGSVLYLAVDSTVLELQLWGGAIATEAAKVVAIAAAFAVLGAVSRLRGWSEVNGVLDGVVYGATAGLGLAVGVTFIRELVLSSNTLVTTAGGGAELVTVSLLGLSEGIFGAIIGAGFGAAVVARDKATRFALPVVGVVVAVLAHVGYDFLRTGSSFAGATAVTLKWVSLLLPLAVLAAAVVHAVVREQRAIAAELADEAGAGVVTEGELALLRSFTARRAAYARLFFAGDFTAWSDQRELHNRQVKLALTEAHYRGATDPDRREQLLAEVQRLRASILELKSNAIVDATADLALSTEA